MRMHLKGSATFKACVDDEVRQVTLLEVYYAENLPWNVISYGNIEELGYELCYDGPKRYAGRRRDGCKVLDVHKDARNVLVVKVVNAEAKKDIDYVTMVLAETVNATYSDVQAVFWIFIYVLAIFLTTQLRAWHVTLTMEGDAAEYAAYILNRSPSQGNIGRASPTEVLTGHKVLDRREEEGFIIGKNDEVKEYRVLFTKDRITETGEEKTSSTCDDVGNREESQAKTQKWKTRGKRGGQGKRLSQKVADRTDVNSPVLSMATRYGGKKTLSREIIGAVYHEDPTSWKAAMKSDKRVEWERASKVEIDSLVANHTWEALTRNDEMPPLHTKWVFKTKTDANSNVERYKARMVACGNEQSLGENYTLTFAAVMDMTTSKASTEPEINIYLYVPQGKIVEQVELPRLGAQHSGKVVLRLQRSLYGLKQAGRLCSELLQKKLLRAGFVQCVTDTCLYFKIDSGGRTVVGLYVDDLLATGTTQERVD
uniref:Uncharacterized protein AlNc14C547G12121 n=1 Tax=Albugo laibachii Nc14 TaxID=890382 RepID=F0X131_9STRA|nr:hypothetical protein ALNC14_136270 [Albugo laibachii Nc14]|eukprot:CCA27483.1 hypothetical protein ALNC14_136270 [Albugo laibachii Nc14]